MSVDTGSGDGWDAREDMVQIAQARPCALCGLRGRESGETSEPLLGWLRSAIGFAFHIPLEA